MSMPKTNPTPAPMGSPNPVLLKIIPIPAPNIIPIKAVLFFFIILKSVGNDTAN